MTAPSDLRRKVYVVDEVGARLSDVVAAALLRGADPPAGPTVEAALLDAIGGAMGVGAGVALPAVGGAGAGSCTNHQAAASPRAAAPKKASRFML